jgi:hypothetical protein
VKPAVGPVVRYQQLRPQPAGAVFMTLLERTFGRDITTRT